MDQTEVDILTRSLVIPELGKIITLIPKCALTSMKEAIAIETGRINGARDLSDPDLFDRVHPERVLAKYRDWQRIAFVRNPYDRLVSGWFGHASLRAAIRRGRSTTGNTIPATFADFVRYVHATPDDRINRHFKSMAWYLIHGGELIASFLGRFETLDRDWARAGFTVPLRHRNASPDRNGATPREMFTPETRALAAERYAADFDRFGYDREVAA